MNTSVIETDKEIRYNLYNITNSNNYSMIRDYKTSIKPIKDEHTMFLREFNIIITNNGLNEGIELSMCDTVAFIMPKTLEHEIIQNFGRCLRKIPKKNKAYIIFSEGIMLELDKICIGPYDTIIKVNKRIKSNSTSMCYI
jgi:predicted helicase